MKKAESHAFGVRLPEDLSNLNYKELATYNSSANEIVRDKREFFMTERDKDYGIAKELKEKLSKVVNLIDFRVFGSRARGDEDEYSDMDVFINVGKT